MIYFILPTLVFIAASASIFSQEAPWSEQFSAVQDNLNDVYFENEMEGWAIGDYGTITHTSNGGTTWKKQNSGTDKFLSSVHFVDSDTGYIVGGTYYSPRFLKTTTGGKLWDSLSVPTLHGLSSVYFIDADTGWVTGTYGTILHTTNGGTSWTKQDVNTQEPLFSVEFINSDTGWITSNVGELYKTTNGGDTWTKHETPTSQDLLDINFINKNIGWAVGGDYGSPIIIKSTDGGISWHQQTAPYDNRLHQVHFINKQIGWVVGFGGTILKTENSGADWNLQESTTFFGLNGLHFPNDSMGWIVGNYGKVLHSTQTVKTGNENTSIQSQPTISHYNVENKITINFESTIPKEFKIDMFNMLGQKTLSKHKTANNNKKAVINTDKGLSKGVYILNIYTENPVKNKWNYKVVIN